ncbi:MAG TPA: 4Fe-4S double cluster binding domain-containing protein, partial [Candidatus Wallbacteria bacterium]|nr:4Fe-4S double cluster binding domain-containing protein [Candidatus Wallbacteria bacterium]
RGNNFFYTENGSYNYIEMFAIDRELELIRNVKLKGCSEKCGKCIESCPTRTLCAPYTMSMPGCMSFQTSVSTQFGMGVPSMEMAEMGGGWLYGCDACQDACPFNKDKWTGGEDFPGISSLAPSMRPEKIMEMSYDEIKDAFCSKYWYIKPENLWKWKLNALMAMMNRYSGRYEAPIRLGLIDFDERVRDFSRKVCSKLGLAH